MSVIQCLVLIIASIIILEPFGQCVRGVRSGLYHENDEDQTVAYVTSRRERRAVARNILKLFDLPTKPLHHSRNRNTQTDISACRFIRVIYRHNFGKVEGGPFKFTDADFKAIQESDIILSYSALPRHEYQSKNTLRFDVSETPEFTNALRSELRVYVKPSMNNTWKMLLFDSQDFVDSFIVRSEGWTKFNTDRVLKRWLSCSGCNRELYLFIVSLDTDISGDKILILDEPQKNPFLVGYFINTHRPSAHATVPIIRSKRNPTSKAPRNYLDNPYSGMHENGRRRRTSCGIHSLHVRFSELDFNKYIVEPDGFDARYCHGECRFPLTAHMNATNHALVQTLVHFIRPSIAPRVLCAPREYEHLPVFYSRDGNNFVYKVYREMIVKSCGCC